MESYYKCRLCLEECNKNIEIFKEDFPQMIELLTGLKINSNDGLPKTSCQQCYREVKSAMLTRYQILNSHKILLEEIKASHFKFSNEAIIDACNDMKKEVSSTNNNNFEDGQIKTNSLEHNVILNVTLDKNSILEEIEENSNLFSDFMSDYKGSNTESKQKFEEVDIKKDPESEPNSDEGSESESYVEYENSDNSLSSTEADNLIENAEDIIAAAKSNPSKKEERAFKKLIRRLQSHEGRKSSRKKKKQSMTKEYKKKRALKEEDSIYKVKVNYELKPEHQAYLRSVGKKDRATCPVCSKEMFGANLKSHLITHTYDPTPCHLCGRTSKNAQALQDHINYFHKTTPDRFICDQCGKGFRVPCSLEKHKQREHQGIREKPFECHVCGKRFYEKIFKMDEYYKCRLCLEESNRNIDIFKEGEFCNMIELLTGIKVDPEDGLPKNSCLQCHQEVKSAMLTRYQIINSYKILINELQSQLKISYDDIKPSSHDFPLPDVSSKEYTVLHDKDQNNVSINQYDEICEFVESEIDNLDSIKNRNTSQLSIENTEVDQRKIKNDDFTDNSDSDDNFEENETFENLVGQSISSYKVNDTMISSVEIEKQEYNKDLIKLRKKRKLANQDIKFKRKRGHKQKILQKKVQFKKKSQSDPYHVKVDYNIKPEHMELVKTIGKKDRVACPICQREMYGMNLKNHLITHNFDPVICDTCGKTSKNAQALQDHINYYHKTTPDRFMCDKCGKGYRVRFMLERHEKKEHGNGEKDYECTICGKKFFEKLQLKNHINITHNKIKPFKCEHCGKDFGRRTQFVTHQLVHTKENRYHCQVCGKGFKIKQTMQTHLKGVHGIEEEKTIFCKICQKGFASAQGLRAHVNSRVHGLEKCEHCSEYITFEYKDVHLKEIHGIDTKNIFS